MKPYETYSCIQIAGEILLADGPKCWSNSRIPRVFCWFIPIPFSLAYLQLSVDCIVPDEFCWLIDANLGCPKNCLCIPELGVPHAETNWFLIAAKTIDFVELIMTSCCFNSQFSFPIACLFFKVLWNSHCVVPDLASWKGQHSVGWNRWNLHQPIKSDTT